MSRIVKILPARRADYSFGDLLYWHLFVYGTRPGGDPAAPAGREWDAASFCRKLNITDRTLRNWLAHRSLPDSANDLAAALFGDNPLFDVWRFEIGEALRAARLEKSRKSRSGFRLETGERPDAAAEDDAASEPGPSGEAGRPGASESSSTGADRSAAVVPFTPRRSHERASNDRGGTVIHPVWSSRGSGNARSPSPGKLGRVVVPGLVILIGLYAWTRPDVHTPSGGMKNPDGAAQPAPPAPAPVPMPEKIRQPEPSAPQPSPAPENKTIAPKPIEQPRAEAPPVTEPKRRDQDARAAEEQRVALLAIQARQDAFDAERRARDEEARRRDQQADDETKAHQDRESASRQVAGIGFRLLENQSATGASLGLVHAETVSDCALSCLRAGCDGFAFPADPPTPKLRDCYRYKAPISFYAHGTFRAGKRIEDVAVTPKLADAGGITTDAPSVLAQAATPPTSPVKPEDVTRCANGPVKVTGFRITCDKILTGGRTLGSAQLRYTVPNINACAAKCRPLAGCTGFTFNAADPEGQHACEIFGGASGMNDGSGWVSGQR